MSATDAPQPTTVKDESKQQHGKIKKGKLRGRGNGGGRGAGQSPLKRRLNQQKNLNGQVVQPTNIRKGQSVVPVASIPAEAARGRVWRNKKQKQSQNELPKKRRQLKKRKGKPHKKVCYIS